MIRYSKQVIRSKRSKNVLDRKIYNLRTRFAEAAAQLSDSQHARRVAYLWAFRETSGALLEFMQGCEIKPNWVQWCKHNVVFQCNVFDVASKV